jgi:quercetin dioxygenase-like cupin family protein
MDAPTAAATTATAPAQPDDIWFDQMLLRVLVPAAATGGTVSVVEQFHRQGYGTPVHVHSREDQILYVLAGAITAELGGERRRLGAGEAAFLPRGTAHAFRVDEEGTRLLEINTPGGFEEFHRDGGEPAARPELPPVAEPDLARMVAAADAHGCAIVGPPMA